jgi:hypothetical protein
MAVVVVVLEFVRDFIHLDLDGGDILGEYRPTAEVAIEDSLDVHVISL